MQSSPSRMLQCAYPFLYALFAVALSGAGRQGQLPRANDTSFRQGAARGIQRLQSWYDPATGLYRTTGWWNSANAITTLVDYARATGDQQYESVFPNVFSAAQQTSPGFLNNFYDDEGWWALAWIDVYDHTRQQQYLQMGEAIFNDMEKGWDDTCSGGIWWSKDRKYKNAIANELFLSVAAHLLVRTTNKELKTQYLRWARREWQWFSHTGMISSGHLINDGLDAKCMNNHLTVWTYNQGVILGGLSEFYKQTHRRSLLMRADEIAAAAISSRTLTDDHGILHESCEPDCGSDGTQFKGIFVRNLALLYNVSPSAQYKAFVETNAGSILQEMQAPDHAIGTRWNAPYGTINASTQSSGDDVLVSAVSMKAH